MRKFFALCLMVLVVAGVATAQERQINQYAVNIDGGVVAQESTFSVDFFNPVFEHDDVMSCREYKTASSIIKNLCDQPGVAAAEFSRFGMKIRPARLVPYETVVQLALSSLGDAKNMRFELMPAWSNIQIQPLNIQQGAEPTADAPSPPGLQITVGADSLQVVLTGSTFGGTESCTTEPKTPLLKALCGISGVSGIEVMSSNAFVVRKAKRGDTAAIAHRVIQILNKAGVV